MTITRFAIFLLMTACTSLTLSPPAAAAGDATKGKAVFARCIACHDLRPGVKKIGPDLAGLWSRKAGGKAGFVYSPAMRKYGKVWNDKTLDTYLTAPMKAIPGTRMAFAGISNPADRANLIAYLKQATR